MSINTYYNELHSRNTYVTYVLRNVYSTQYLFNSIERHYIALYRGVVYGGDVARLEEADDENDLKIVGPRYRF